MAQPADDPPTPLSSAVSFFADPLDPLPTDVRSAISTARPRSTRAEEDDRTTTTQSSRVSPRPTTTESSSEPPSTSQRRSTDNPSSSSSQVRTTEKTDASSSTKNVSPTTSSATPTSSASSSSSSSSTRDTFTTSSTASSTPSTSSNLQSTSSITTVTLASSPRTTTTSTTQPTSSATTPSISAASATSSPAAGPAKGGMTQGGVIVASVAGTLAIFSVVLLLIFCVRRRRQKSVRPGKDSWMDDVDLGSSAHSRSASGSFASRESGLRPVPPLGPPRRVSPPPLLIPSKELQPDVVSSVPMHPPQGYTRPARVHSVTSDQPGHAPRRRSQDEAPPEWPTTGLPSRDEAFEFNLTAPRRNSLFLPTSVTHPPPIRQLQTPPPLSHGYQPYKPLAIRYQVPTTIPEEDGSVVGRGRHSVDGSPPKVYLPGERTRSPPNNLPASLTAGNGIERPASADVTVSMRVR